MVEIKEYYESVDFSPIFEIDKDFFKFRHIRIIDKDGIWRKVLADYINSPEKLRKVMLKYEPLKAYYSVGRFLNASRVGARKPTFHEGIFLKQDWFVFDIDDDVYNNAKRLMEFIEDKKYEILYMIYSGSRGVHIAIKRELKCDRLYPQDREAWYLKKNTELLKEVTEYGVKVDGAVVNTRQIVKIPLTIDGSTGNVCKFLNSLEDIKKLPLRAKKGNDLNPNVKYLEVGDKEGLSSASSISNNVLGMKDHFVIFINDTLTQFDEFSKLLKRAIVEYGLSDFYVFEGRNGFYAICLDVVHRDRLRKILKRFKYSYSEFEKFGFNLLPLKDLRWYVGTVSGSVYLPKPYSKGHYNFLLWLKLTRFEELPVRNYPNLVGDSKTKIFMVATTEKILEAVKYGECDDA